MLRESWIIYWMYKRCAFNSNQIDYLFKHLTTALLPLHLQLCTPVFIKSNSTQKYCILHSFGSKRSIKVSKLLIQRQILLRHHRAEKQTNKLKKNSNKHKFNIFISIVLNDQSIMLAYHSIILSTSMNLCRWWLRYRINWTLTEFGTFIQFRVLIEIKSINKFNLEKTETET